MYMQFVSALSIPVMCLCLSAILGLLK